MSWNQLVEGWPFAAALIGVAVRGENRLGTLSARADVLESQHEDVIARLDRIENKLDALTARRG